MTIQKEDKALEVYNAIIEQIDKGVPPWKIGWLVQRDCNKVSGTCYKGQNKLILSYVRKVHNYSSEWMTFKQAQGLTNDNNIRIMAKGIKSTQCMRYSAYENSKGEMKGYVKSFFVFNVDQFSEEFKELYYKKYPRKSNAIDTVQDIDTAITTYVSTIEIKYGGDKACYIPSQHCIKLPEINSFHSTVEYYETLFHELVHSTSKELKREIETHTRNVTYSFEELVAEFGASMLCAHFNMETDFSNNASYIENWRKSGNFDKNKMFEAYNLACKAVELILANPEVEVDDV